MKLLKWVKSKFTKTETVYYDSILPNYKSEFTYLKSSKLLMCKTLIYFEHANEYETFFIREYSVEPEKVDIIKNGYQKQVINNHKYNFLTNRNYKFINDLVSEKLKLYNSVTLLYTDEEGNEYKMIIKFHDKSYVYKNNIFIFALTHSGNGFLKMVLEQDYINQKDCFEITNKIIEENEKI